MTVQIFLFINSALLNILSPLHHSRGKNPIGNIFSIRIEAETKKEE